MTITKGCSKQNKNGEWMTVVEYINSKKMLIVFDNHHIAPENNLPVVCTKDNYLNGRVKNPFSPSVCGIGYMGVGIYTSMDIPYKPWVHELERHCSIKGAKLWSQTCVEWENYQVFAAWFMSQYESRWCKQDESIEWNVEKDLFGNGGSVYSPETTCILPKELNLMLRVNSGYVGLKEQSNGNWIVTSQVGGSKVVLDEYGSPWSAYHARLAVQQANITIAAQKYKHMLSERVYLQVVNGYWKNLAAKKTPELLLIEHEYSMLSEEELCKMTTGSMDRWNKKILEVCSSK